MKICRFISVVLLFVSFSSFISCNVISDDDTVFGLQLKVASQDPKGGSCGYHALKNGLLIARSIFTQFNPADDLLNKHYVESLFGKNCSEWRLIAIEQKAQLFGYTKILSYFKNILLKDLLEKDSELMQIIQKVSKKLAHNCMLKDLNNEQPIFRYLITKENILDEIAAFGYLNDGLKSVIEDILFTIDNNQLANFNIYEAFLELNSLDDLINYYAGYLLDPTSKALFQYWVLSQKGKIDKNALLGEFITMKLIQNIFFYEKNKKNSLFKDLNIGLYDYLDHTSSRINDLKTKINNISQEFVSILIIAMTNEHWVTCVVNKPKYRKPCYIFADSCNSDLLQSKAVCDVISKLEDKTIKLVGLKEIEAQNQKLMDSLNSYYAYNRCHSCPTHIEHLINSIKKINFEFDKDRYIAQVNFRAEHENFLKKLRKANRNCKEVFEFIEQNICRLSLKGKAIDVTEQSIIIKNLTDEFRQMNRVANYFKNCNQDIFDLNEIEKIINIVGLKDSYLRNLQLQMGNSITKDQLVNWFKDETNSIVVKIKKIINPGKIIA